METLTLASSLSQHLRDMSRREGVTLFMTLLAIFQILLYRYSGQEDLIVGVPIANRNRAEIEGLIGFLSIRWPCAQTFQETHHSMNSLCACAR